MTDYGAYASAFALPPPFRVGRVLVCALGVFERQWARLLGATLLACLGLFAAIAVLVGIFIGGILLLNQTSGLQSGLALREPFVLKILLGIPALVLAMAFCGGMIAMPVATVLADLGGTRPRFGRAFRRGAWRCLALTGIFLLLLVPMAIGMVLLVLPGILVIAFGSIATMACIVERAGPIDSLRRAAYLTRGNRWRLVGLALCGMVIGWIPAAVQLLVKDISLLATPERPLLMTLLGTALIVAFNWTLSTIVSLSYGVAYHDLVRLQDGAASEAIADALES